MSPQNEPGGVKVVMTDPVVVNFVIIFVTAFEPQRYVPSKARPYQAAAVLIVLKMLPVVVRRKIRVLSLVQKYEPVKWTPLIWLGKVILLTTEPVVVVW